MGRHHQPLVTHVYQSLAFLIAGNSKIATRPIPARPTTSQGPKFVE